MPPKPCVLICGAGSQGHGLAGVAGSTGAAIVNVLSIYEDEADMWSSALDGGDMIVSYEEFDETKEMKSKINLITSNIEEALKDVEIVIIAVPGCAQEPYLEALAPNLKSGITIAGLPGEFGFEYSCKKVFGEKADQYNFISFDCAPYSCRIMQGGKRVELYGIKYVLSGAAFTGKCRPKRPPLSSLQMLVSILGKPKIRTFSNYLDTVFMSKSYIFPAILYQTWKDWDGTKYESVPPFNDINKSAEKFLLTIGEEIISLAASMTAQRPDVDLFNIPGLNLTKWLKDYHRDDIEDQSTLEDCINTNKAFSRISLPVKKEEGGYVPDYSHKFLTNLIPYGLVGLRAIATLAEISTPAIDEVIMWGQEKIEKEYLVDGQLTGKDIAETRIPQQYGCNTIQSVLDFDLAKN